MEKPSDPQATTRKESPKKRWVEPVTAVLMALATVGTAWCSYKSAAWTRRSNRLMNEYNSLERRAGVLSLQGMQSATIHPPCSCNYSRRGRQGTRNWRIFTSNVSRPMSGRPTMPGWRRNLLKIRRPIRIRLCRISTSCAARARLRNRVRKRQQPSGSSPCRQYVGQYLANTVLFATMLFFANAASKFEQKRVRVVAFAFAVAVFAFAVVRMALLPR